jgi:hypothetical protein
MEIRERGLMSVDLILLAEYEEKWLAVVNAVMSSQVQ